MNKRGAEFGRKEHRRRVRRGDSKPHPGSGQSSLAGIKLSKLSVLHTLHRLFHLMPKQPKEVGVIITLILQTRNLNKSRLGNLPKVTSQWGFEPQQSGVQTSGQLSRSYTGEWGRAAVWENAQLLLQRATSEK